MYFFLPGICKMNDDKHKHKLLEWTIVSYSPAAWQIRRGSYVNWYSNFGPGYEMLAGLYVERVSWTYYAKHLLKTFRSWLSKKLSYCKG